jgi:hypothetical protein
MPNSFHVSFAQQKQKGNTDIFIFSTSLQQVFQATFYHFQTNIDNK